MQQQDVEQLVEQVAQKLGRGLSLEDLDGLLLAYSSNQSHADRVRVNFLLSKRVPADVSAWQLSHGIATAVRPVVIPANPELGMLGRVCVPLMVRGFRVGYLWVQQDSAEENPTAILSQLPEVTQEIELLSGLLLDSNTAESEFRRGREREFLAACSGEANAVAAVAGWKEIQGKGPWQMVTVLDADGWAGGPDPIASTLIHRSAALQATIGVDMALFSAGTETHSVVLFRSPWAAPTMPRCWSTTSWSWPNAPAARCTASSWASARVSPSRASSPRRTGNPGRRRRPRRWIPSWANWWTAGPPGFTSCWHRPAAEPAPGRTPGPSTVRMLEDHDRNDELLPVLELIYDNDGSVQDVATKLHLHRSSIYNRLGRIRAAPRRRPAQGHAPAGTPCRAENAALGGTAQDWPGLGPGLAAFLHAWTVPGC